MIGAKLGIDRILERLAPVAGNVYKGPYKWGRAVVITVLPPELLLQKPTSNVFEREARPPLRRLEIIRTLHDFLSSQRLEAFSLHRDAVRCKARTFANLSMGGRSTTQRAIDYINRRRALRGARTRHHSSRTQPARNGLTRSGH